MAWNFPDPPETGVYTTRQVFVEGELLCLVSHDLDGDWQFLREAEEDDEAGEFPRRGRPDATCTSRRIVEPVPGGRASLQTCRPGWMATRETAGAPWARAPQPKEWATE